MYDMEKPQVDNRVQWMAAAGYRIGTVQRVAPNGATTVLLSDGWTLTTWPEHLRAIRHSPIR